MASSTVQAKDSASVPSVHMGPAKPPAPYNSDNVDQFIKDMGKVPLFMTNSDLGKDDEGNDLPELAALKGMAFEGTPQENALNFKNQGNESYKLKQYHDGIELYSRALSVKCDNQDINKACYLNRAACNLQLKNYRKVIQDCAKVMELDPFSIKAYYRAAQAYLAIDKPDDSAELIRRAQEITKRVEPQGKLDEGFLNMIPQIKARQIAIAKTIQQQQERKLQLVTLKAAVKARNLLLTKQDPSQESSVVLPPDAKIRLSNPVDLNSTLLLPLLLLYPLTYQSDFLTAVEEFATINQIINNVLGGEPAPWDSQHEYTPSQVLVFVEDKEGGLMKAGKKLSLIEALQTKQQGEEESSSSIIPIVDSIVRLYIIPSNRLSEWINIRKSKAQK